jgi:glycosyltransferase involved in cell wall biosynthesis
MKVRRILVSAYGCEPGKGSEQGVGWNWTLQLARFAELVVLTRSNNRSAIEAALPEATKNRIRFEYYDLPPSIARFKRKEKGLYFYYLLWQWGAYQRARELVRQSHFDYAISLTFGSIWMPTFIHRLPVSFIWGPVGGGEAVPFGLIGVLPFRSRIPQYLRYLLMAAVPANPLVMGPVRRARAVLTRTEDTACLIPSRYANKVSVVLETAVSDDLIRRKVHAQPQAEGGPLRVIYSGRLVALKNVPAALHAVARARAAGGDIQLVIVGDGPERKPLESLCRSLGISKAVQFLGTTSQAQVIEELNRSDIYLFPSLKEGGVWSLIEAMSAGLPVVCVKSSGMALITDEASAIRVDPVSQEHMITGFANALLELARSPERRLQMGLSARRRIEQHFRWEHKGHFMQELFDRLERSSA